MPKRRTRKQFPPREQDRNDQGLPFDTPGQVKIYTTKTVAKGVKQQNVFYIKPRR